LFFGLVAIGLGVAFVVSGATFQGGDRDMLTAAVLFIFGGTTLLLYWRMTAKDREYSRRIYEEHLEKISLHFAVGDSGKTTEETPTGTE